jgi:hypothetical protein
MSTSIPISQLNETMYVTEDDMISIVDSGSITTFRATVKTVKDYFALSGSALSASWASASISASYAVNCDTASYMYPRVYDMTASWANNLVDGAVAGTASLAYHALTASRLEGIGSSYVERMSVSADVSITSSGHVSLRSRNQLTSSATTDSIKGQTLFFSKDYKAITQPAGITGYGKLFHFDDGTQKQKMVFDVGHDYVATPDGPDINFIAGNSQGILFQSDEAGNPNGLSRTSSLVFLSASGVTYGRTFEGYVYSSSIATTGPVSFYGTASCASGSDYALNSPFPLPMAAVVAFAGTPTSSVWVDWAWSRGETYNQIAYPPFAAQVGTSFGTQATITESIFNNTRRISIGVTAGSSGILSVYWNNATTYYFNLVDYPYNIVISSLSNNHNYPYVITDYGWYPSVSVSRTLCLSSSVFANAFLSYTLGTNDYRVPNMNQYFRTNTVLDPLNWAIRLGD